MSSNNGTSPTSGDNNSSNASRSWFAVNSWVVSPLIVFVIVGLICVALHTYRSRRLRRHVQLAHQENLHTSSWPRRRTHFHSHSHSSSHDATDSRGGPQRDPELGFVPARGSLLDGLQNGGGNNTNGDTSAPAPAARGRRWQNPLRRWGGTTHRPQDEGLDEFGEAPPPYEHNNKPKTVDGPHRRHVVGADAVELARMRAAAGDRPVGDRQAGEEGPPAYGDVAASSAGRESPPQPPPAEGEVQGHEGLRNGEAAVTRPERVQVR